MAFAVVDQIASVHASVGELVQYPHESGDLGGVPVRRIVTGGVQVGRLRFAVAFAESVGHRAAEFALDGREAVEQEIAQRIVELEDGDHVVERRAGPVCAGHGIAQEVFVAVDEGEVADIAQGVFGGVLVWHGKTLGLEMGQLIFVCTERLCQNPPRMQKRRTRGPSSRSRASQVSGT